MNADKLQKYILQLNQKVRSMRKSNNKDNEGFNQAIAEVSNFLSEEREVVVQSYKNLTDRGAL